MSSQIPFTPLTPEAVSRLTPSERDTFMLATGMLAVSQKPSMGTVVELVETIHRLIVEQRPEAREVKRLEASAAAGDALIREILEALCRRDGLPLESSVVPGEPARNYDLAMRLGIGHVFGIMDQQAGVPAASCGWCRDPYCAGDHSGDAETELRAGVPAVPEEPIRIEVTVRDLGTGASQTAVISDDYVLICAGSCYRANVEADLASGTHVITVEGVKRS